MADAVRDYGAEVTVMVHVLKIPKRLSFRSCGIFAGGICYLAAERSRQSSCAADESYEASQ